MELWNAITKFFELTCWSVNWVAGLFVHSLCKTMQQKEEHGISNHGFPYKNHILVNPRGMEKGKVKILSQNRHLFWIVGWAWICTKCGLPGWVRSTALRPLLKSVQYSFFVSCSTNPQSYQGNEKSKIASFNLVGSNPNYFDHFKNVT